jgi:Transposase zinc-ribbon domain/ISXO2-like transposase domain
MEDYPRNLAEFEARFSTEAACREYLVRLRWPDGFRCPRCGGQKTWPLSDAVLQCAGCNYQSSVTAGTIFQDTRKPLTLWFRAMWAVTSQKNGASAIGLQRVLGLGSYKTAWTWLHKLRRAMVRPGRDRLSGCVEVDETFYGGEEEGVRGRQTENKSLIVIAAQEDGAGIGRIRMRRIPDASAQSLMPFIEEVIASGSVVHRRLDGISSGGKERLPSPRHISEGQKGIAVGIAAAGSLCGIAAEAVAAGHPSRCRQPGASGLLPGRVHIPF